MIVLGKRKSNPFKWVGDSITEYVVEAFDGTVLLMDSKRRIDVNQELSLGILNDLDTLEEGRWEYELIKNRSIP